MGCNGKNAQKIALCRPLDQRINDRIRPEENYIACSKLFLVDLLAPILLGTQADTKFSKIVEILKNTFRLAIYFFTSKVWRVINFLHFLRYNCTIFETYVHCEFLSAGELFVAFRWPPPVSVWCQRPGNHSEKYGQK